MGRVAIVGGGIGGLTLALLLHRRGIECDIFEAASEIKPLGVGINILPQAAAVLCGELDLERALAARAVLTHEASFFNRFGQLIFTEPLGRAGGNAWPQFSIHRADLHQVLLDAVASRLGADRLHLGWRCTGVTQDSAAARVTFVDARTDAEHPPQIADAVIGCDGLHSAIRKQLHPDEGEPLYSGVNMWRGVTRWPPILSGATMIRAGWFTPGKLVAYPIRDQVDAEGRQLVNWLAEIARLRGPEAASAGQAVSAKARDWNREAQLEEFVHVFADWRFEWLDVPAFLRSADLILEFPMIDQEPLPHWTVERMTLLGDAAHPMYPRGSNGAGQAILDAHSLATELVRTRDWLDALRAYERTRLPATAAVVRMSRTNPPDAILREVYERTGDRPFERIEDVISRSEMINLLDSYRRVTAGQRS
jgi:2-polyprenyl-6-methoxyphenol hydroxylase-like FAD-dependent oxidoreductase